MCLDERRINLFRRIGDLWRGDWSGSSFDGRDGKRWIDTILDGTDSQVDKIEDWIKSLEEEYE